MARGEVTRKPYPCDDPSPNEVPGTLKRAVGTRMTLPIVSLADDLALARRLAVLATEVALDYFARGVAAEKKPDGTPVTEADVHIERLLSSELARERAADAILGEELGAQGASNRRWILDPIDGTAYFARGEPDWGTHVALEVDGQVVVGVITRPAKHRCYFAARGTGAFRSEIALDSPATKLHVSTETDFARSRITTWSRHTDPLIERVKSAAVWVEPAADNILRVAEGEVDAVIDRLGKPWDHAPAVVLVEEAGGAFSDLAGGRRLDRGEGLYTNGHLRSQLDALLAGVRGLT
jgi:histidinol-phosphatase